MHVYRDNSQNYWDYEKQGKHLIQMVCIIIGIKFTDCEVVSMNVLMKYMYKTD